MPEFLDGHRCAETINCSASPYHPQRITKLVELDDAFRIDNRLVLIMRKELESLFRNAGPDAAAGYLVQGRPPTQA
jgi:hypothetical protein